MAKQLKKLFEQEKHKSCDDEYSLLTSAQLRDLLSAYGITGISQYSKRELCEMATFVQPDISILSSPKKKKRKIDSGKDGKETKNVTESSAVLSNKQKKRASQSCEIVFGSKHLYWENYVKVMAVQTAVNYYNHLSTLVVELSKTHEQKKIFGRPQPRLTEYFSLDTKESYSYSGRVQSK